MQITLYRSIHVFFQLIILLKVPEINKTRRVRIMDIIFDSRNYIETQNKLINIICLFFVAFVAYFLFLKQDGNMGYFSHRPTSEDE